MSENTNTFITGEVYPYQITDRTLSFIPKLSPAADDHFKELVTGKIKISLYDFSNGKGDNGIYTYFNLDLKQFRYIYERAKLSHLPAPYESSKIHCQSVETDGPFKGYCKSFRFYLARNVTYIDKKTGETCTRRAPWYSKAVGFEFKRSGLYTLAMKDEQKTYILHGHAEKVIHGKNGYCGIYVPIKRYQNGSFQTVWYLASFFNSNISVVKGDTVFLRGYRISDKSYNGFDYLDLTCSDIIGIHNL